MTTTVTRYDLQQIKGMTPKLLRALEELFVDTAIAGDAAAGAVAATGAIQNATVLTLSSNAAFGNERVLSLDPGQFSVTDGGAGGQLLVTLLAGIALNGGFRCTFNLEADTNLDLPSLGRVPSSADGPYADDAAATAAGVQVGEWYAKTGGTVAWRVT
jgi:hypothetical protein